MSVHDEHKVAIVRGQAEHIFSTKMRSARPFGMALVALLAMAGCDGAPRPEGNTGEAEEAAEGASSEAQEAETSAETAPPVRPNEERAPTVSETEPTLAGIRWTVAAPLTWRAPSRPMRNAEYVVNEGPDEAVLTVFHFPGMGGDIRSNVDRWVAQFRTDDGSPAPATIEEAAVNGLTVTTVDSRGTFTGGMVSNAPPQEGSRLLGAIVEGEDGPVFFKLIGPEASVSEAESAFGQLVESVAPAQ